MARSVLVADLGASTTRLALASAKDGLNSVRSVAAKLNESPEVVLEAALAGTTPRPNAAVLAVAAPIDGDYVSMTNREWSFSQKALAKSLRLKRLVVVNDFVAVAHALPSLGKADLVTVGGGHAAPKGTLLACGPGTGFGVSALVRSARTHVAFPSEAGHMRMGATAADEARVLAHLVQELGPVVIDQVISGPGLVRLHKILSGEQASTEEIVIAARSGRPRAKETVDFFLRGFGRIAGDLALAFDARGGMFLAGGISRALAPLIPVSKFREAFDNHPPYQARLAAIPIHVIVHPAPGLLGAAAIARQKKIF